MLIYKREEAKGKERWEQELRQGLQRRNERGIEVEGVGWVAEREKSMGDCRRVQMKKNKWGSWDVVLWGRGVFFTWVLYSFVI